MAQHPGTEWQFVGFTFRPAVSESRRDGAPVAAEPQSLALLELLIRHRDRVVTRDDLVAELWSGRAVSDWAISGAVRALRRALGDTGRPKQIVRTVHSRGFRFVADIEETAGTGADSQDADRRPVILVRAFRAPSEEAEEAYLAEGMTEDLITDLARHAGLSVLSYNTTRAMGAAPPPPEMGVVRIIDGSLRRVGDVIRVNAAVLDGRAERQIWAERFDLDPAALVAAQDLISGRLVGVLAPGADPSSEAGRRGTRNSQAYDRYMQGRYAYFRYEPAAFAEALTHFTAATDLDPAFADAFAQQAYCRTTLFVFGLPGADTSLAPAEALARRAIALRDDAALGHVRLGWVLGFGGQADAAVAAFEAALVRAPDSTEVLHAYGETMNRLAQPDRGLALIEAAFSRDSYFPPSWEFAEGHARVLLGDTDRAIGHFRAVLERVPRFVPARVQLVRALWEAKRPDAARTEVAAIRKVAPKYGLGHAARMFPYPVPHEADRLQMALKGAGLV